MLVVIQCGRGSIHWGGAGGKLLPQTPKLSPQNMVTDHGDQEILGLNRIKSDLKIRKFPGGYSGPDVYMYM